MDLFFLLVLLLVLTEERVAAQLVYAHSLLRVLPHQVLDKRYCVLRQARWEFYRVCLHLYYFTFTFIILFIVYLRLM